MFSAARGLSTPTALSVPDYFDRPSVSCLPQEKIAKKRVPIGSAFL